MRSEVAHLEAAAGAQLLRNILGLYSLPLKAWSIYILKYTFFLQTHPTTVALQTATLGKQTSQEVQNS